MTTLSLKEKEFNLNNKTNGIPAWPLALTCALVPIFSVHLAYWISIHAGYVPTCIPYIDGCTSISRAARYGLGNSLFRAMMLPLASLQAFVCYLCYKWIKNLNPIKKAGRTLPLLGVIAGLFLSLYVTFLGTDGDIYNLLRRFGVTVYFLSTYLAQLVVLYRIEPLNLGRIPKIMLGICIVLLIIGGSSVYLSAAIEDPTLNDHVENIVEWNMSFLIIIWFFLLSRIWYKQNLKLDLNHTNFKQS